MEKKRKQVVVDTPFILKHQELRKQNEILCFGEGEFFDSGVNCKRVDTGEANSEGVKRWILDLAPEYVFLFGSTIIKEPLLNNFNNRMLNLHMGLSPYYRGAATNIWPIVYKEPECVGGTFHLATEQVDMGHVIHQARPDLQPNDDLHDIGNKCLVASAKGLNHVRMELESGIDKTDKTKSEAKADKVGRVFGARDFTEERLREAYTNLKEGLILSYLTEKVVRDNRFPIVELTHVVDS
jgi:folate-dependent phosphoribosylglycinamide formyltransferase PurN